MTDAESYLQDAAVMGIVGTFILLVIMFTPIVHWIATVLLGLMSAWLLFGCVYNWVNYRRAVAMEVMKALERL